MILGKRIKLMTVISFVVMLLANYGANALRLNGMTTADVSGIYQNPLTPAGFTFAIWGLIYMLLLLHVLFVCGLFKAERSSLTAEDSNRIERAFIISSFANVAWILAWQYLLIPLSLVLIVVIFICLVFIANTLRGKKLSAREALFVKIPFSIYLGWITVAVLQNVCVILASFGVWSFEEPFPDVLAILILTVGLIVVIVLTWANRQAAYALVALWAYVGIGVRYDVWSINLTAPHASIVVALDVCIVALAAIAIVALFKRIRMQK